MVTAPNIHTSVPRPDPAKLFCDALNQILFTARKYRDYELSFMPRRQGDKPLTFDEWQAVR